MNPAGTSLTVVVPTNATTGHVRLARDNAGVLLQIVPTLGDVTMTSVGGVYTGANLQLAGSGFAEGATSVLMGGQSIEDIARNQGLDVFSSGTRINLTVPSGAPTGPIQVRTVGGTSTAFGIAFTGISATAASGTPQEAGVASANPGQAITIQGSGLDSSTDVVFQTIDQSGNRSEVVVRPSAITGGGTQATVTVPVNAVSGTVRVVGTSSGVALQVVPTIVDVQVESVAADGSSATLLIAGTGFVEGGNSEYRFGSLTQLDAGTTTGAEVFGRSDAVLGYLDNGYVRVSVPLSAGVFGAISIKTGGGVSANYTTSLSVIDAVALSGTPADAGQASANAGQAVVLRGTGLSTASDLLVRYVDINGALQMVKLSPTAAAADGTSATLLLPGYLNGAFSVQLFGSASQPLLQIVPTLTSYDVQDRTVVFGSGFVEGATVYSFPGATVADTGADNASNNLDVYYDPSFANQNTSAYINRTALPSHGIGNATITTAGGTSAPLAITSVRVSVSGTALGDVAVDAAGRFWVGDQANPGHLLRIDAATGQALQSITMDASNYGTPYAFNYLGLQVLGASMTLGVTSVPAGSLLVFNGYPNTDRVVAINPSTGATIASLSLDGNYDLTGAVYSATSNRIYLTENNGAGNRIIVINPATGAQTAALTAPFNIQTWSGLAIDPTTGHLWLGGVNGGPQAVEYQVAAGGALTELRRIDLAAQGVNQNEISGISFDASGTLWVASTQGEIYRVIV